MFASNSDWLVVLFTSVVIGQSNNFGFGFKNKILRIGLRESCPGVILKEDAASSRIVERRSVIIKANTCKSRGRREFPVVLFSCSRCRLHSQYFDIPTGGKEVANSTRV